MEKFKERKIIKLLKKSPEDGIKMVIDVYGPAINTICKNNFSLKNFEKNLKIM